MKRFMMTAVVLMGVSQSAMAQFRDAYTESYRSMLGTERAYNQGKMEYQNMLDARSNARQAAVSREIAAQVKNEADYEEHLERDRRRNKKRDVIRERARRFREQGK